MNRLLPIEFGSLQGFPCVTPSGTSCLVVELSNSSWCRGERLGRIYHQLSKIYPQDQIILIGSEERGSRAYLAPAEVEPELPSLLQQFQERRGQPSSCHLPHRTPWREEVAS